MKAAVTVEEKTDEVVSYDPATGEEIGRVPIMSANEVNEAVAEGRECFATWRTTSFAERSRLVMKAREVILGQVDEIANLISRESGKPFGEAIAMEIAPVLDLMQYFAA
ncbi:MAG: aldehyde dehydrogenase family protein [Pyrinomonadaceae bacterium]